MRYLTLAIAILCGGVHTAAAADPNTIMTSDLCLKHDGNWVVGQSEIHPNPSHAKPKTKPKSYQRPAFGTA